MKGAWPMTVSKGHGKSGKENMLSNRDSTILEETWTFLSFYPLALGEKLAFVFA